MDNNGWLLVGIVVLLAFCAWMLYRIASALTTYKGPRWPTVDAKGNIVSYDSKEATPHSLVPRSHEAENLASKIEYLACGLRLLAELVEKRFPKQP
jgi:hypothetical protein